jgi:outer membrane protein OmpA-like peptidoglycan-associated protein
MNRLGKCSNLAGCLLAYRGEVIRINDGAPFKCPECGEELTPLAEEKKRPKFALIIGAAAVLLFMIPLLVALLKPREHRPGNASPTPAVARTTPSPVETPVDAVAVSTPLNVPPATVPVAPVEPSPAPVEAATPTEEAAPTGQVSAPSSINLDTANAENIQVKKDVLQRIDLMPNIASENKDKLYMSVERARQMGRVLTIPFASGKTSVGPAEIAALRQTVQAPQVQQLLNDPTAVFVVLGYADTKGDEKMNLQISQTRAESVLDVLRNDCGVINVMHAVGMGGSSLFDQQNLDKNRIAEVWVVLP